MNFSDKKYAAGILLASALLIPTMALTPLLANIKLAFPNVDEVNIQMVMTLPSLTALPSMLFTPRLSRRFSKQFLLELFIAVESLGGLLPVFFHQSIVDLYVSSSLIGIGMGGITTMSPALIADRFTGNAKGIIMGYQASAAGLGATLLSLLSGYLGNGSWYWGYLCFLLTFPVLCLTKYLFSSSQSRNIGGRKSLPKSRCGASDAEPLPLTIIMVAVIAGIISIFILAYPTNLSSYIHVKGWGGTNISGLASALYNAAMVFSGFVFGKVYRATKTYVMIFAVALALVGMLFVWWGTELIAVLFGGALLGFSYATLQAGGNSVVSTGISPRAQTTAISLFAGCVSIGNSISPLAVTKLSNFLSNSLQSRFLISIIAFVFIIPILLKVSVNLKKIK